MNKTPLILVDGSSYLYRAFHGLPPLKTSQGIPTGAIKGVLTMLARLRKEYTDSPFAVVFDAKGPTFRDQLFTDYKAHRPVMPEELRVQIEPLHACVRALGYPLLCVEGVEADDVIGTLARRSADQQQYVVISTGDKDMAQLVCPYVSLVNTMTDSRYGVAEIEARFGVGPDRIIDYLALMGDSADNIPGVSGVGEKTALGLLLGVGGGLDVLYENLDKVATLPIRGAKSLAEKLRAERDMAYLSYDLARIRLDVPVAADRTDLEVHAPDWAALRVLYEQLEFKRELAALSVPLHRNMGEADLFALAETPAGAVKKQREDFRERLASPPDVCYEAVLDEVHWADWLERLQTAELIALDTETTDLDAHKAQLVGLSVAIHAGTAAYIPLTHSYIGAPQQLNRTMVLRALKPILESPKIRKIGQHIKYDMNVLAHCAIDGDSTQNIHLAGVAFDSMLESYVLNATATRHNLDALALKYLGVQTTSFESIAGKGTKQLTFDQIPLERAAHYAAEDADIALRLHQKLWTEIQKTPALEKVLQLVEMPLVPVLARMEQYGALVDTGLLAVQSQELGARLEVLEQQAFNLAGHSFNLSSPKQLGEMLYTKLGLPILSKTATGQPSTAEAVLAELAEQGFALPQVLMEYRSLSKLKSTYTDRLPEQVNPRTGRIHTSYHQAVTATGRLSSSDPNLQNIPIRTPEGRRIRQAFIAATGYQLIAADYSQIELRIMAHLAQDQGLLEAFQGDLDVHRATAAEVFGVALEEVSTEQRHSAKAINFGLMYGMSAFGLAKQIGCSRPEAQMYIERYFQRYPGVQHYMERIRAEAATQGYVQTLLGRRLYIPDIQSSQQGLRKAAERAAINAPMQGTAADIIKTAMIAVDQWLSTSAFDARMIMQVHDELIVEVRSDQIDSVRAAVCQKMSQAADLSVPLVVEAGVGYNWDQAH